MVDCHNITSARARGLYSYRTLRYFWEHYKYKELKKKVLFQKFDQMFQKFSKFSNVRKCNYFQEEYPHRQKPVETAVCQSSKSN